VCIAFFSFWGAVFFLLFFVIFCAVFWKFFLKPMSETNDVLKYGEDAEAIILSIQENGSSLALGAEVPKPGIRFTLEVYPKNRSSYQAQLDTFVSVIERMSYQPGARVKIKIDRNDPRKVVFSEGLAMMGRKPSSMQDLLPSDVQAKLESLIVEQRDLFAHGEEASAVILDMKEVARVAEGGLPFIQLKVRVSPVQREAFEASVSCLIQLTSLNKFQIGKKIIVKFDSLNTNRVAVVHSDTASS
jgi:hypothetical protein